MFYVKIIVIQIEMGTMGNCKSSEVKPGGRGANSSNSPHEEQSGQISIPQRFGIWM